MSRKFFKVVALSLIMVTLGGHVWAADEDAQSQSSMMRIKTPDGQNKTKVQKRDRSTYGFYAFGGVTLSTFVGQEVYNWHDDIGYMPGYTIGGGFDILRRPNGIYFGSELAITMKGVTKAYQGKPLYKEDPVSSRILLHYFQATPMKIGGRIKLNDDMGISLYTGFGVDLLIGGREKYEKNDSGYEDKLMRRHTDWNGRVDMFVPFNVNFDYKKWSVGVSYDLGINDIIEGRRNQPINRVHNSTIGFRAVYHFRFKDRADKVAKIKSKEVVDRYHRDEF